MVPVAYPVLPVLSLLAALAFLAALSAMGMAGLRHIAPFVTTLELLAYGPVLGTHRNGPAARTRRTTRPRWRGPRVSIFSLLVAAAYWPRGGHWISGGLVQLRSDLGWLPGLVIVLIVARLALLWSGALSLEPTGYGPAINTSGATGPSIWATRLRSHMATTFPQPILASRALPSPITTLTSLTAAGMVAAGLDPIVALPIQRLHLLGRARWSGSMRSGCG